jgi:hypothetical protein
MHARIHERNLSFFFEYAGWSCGRTHEGFEARALEICTIPAITIAGAQAIGSLVARHLCLTEPPVFYLVKNRTQR